jgi:hypothetical protein
VATETAKVMITPIINLIVLDPALINIESHFIGACWPIYVVFD